MASRCGEESGATAFCSESNREGTNILVVKGTAHTGMKDVRTKATVITLASFGVGWSHQLPDVTNYRTLPGNYSILTDSCILRAYSMVLSNAQLLHVV